MYMAKRVLAALFLSALAACSSTSAPCSMSGEMLQDGSCECEAMWTGPTCTLLHQTPSPSAGAAALQTDFSGHQQATWGGSPMRDSDGLYHLFFSWIKMVDNSTAPSIQYWRNSSVVSHATSTQPGEGYTFEDIVLPPRGAGFFDASATHNPTVVALPDGTYAIYYIGLDCVTYPDPDECILHQWIGAAWATDLNGPWERLDQPVLSPSGVGWESTAVANPSVVALADGTLLMAYRGLGDVGVGVATAPSWDGPFMRLNDGAPVLGCDSPGGDPNNKLEDLQIWRTPKGVQMLLHQEGRAEAPYIGAHAYSVDNGTSWTYAGDAYNLTVFDTDGQSTTFSRRERPQLLHGLDGTPTHLFNGVEDAGGYTHTVAMPLVA